MAAPGSSRVVGWWDDIVGHGAVLSVLLQERERRRPDPPGSVEQSGQTNRQEAVLTHTNRTVSAAAELAGADCETLHLNHEHVYQAIIDAAEARRCDLIMMASHGPRGVSAVVLGTGTVKVLTRPKIPVLVYR